MAGRDEWFAINASGPAERSLEKGAGAKAIATGGGGFLVEPEAAPLVRAGFEGAIEEMVRARNAARDMRYLSGVSVNPVVDKYLAALEQVGYGEEGSVTMAADSAVTAYQDVIDQLDRAMASYGGYDGSATATLKPLS